MPERHGSGLPSGRRKDIEAVAVIGLFYLGLEALGITCPILFLTGISCAGCGMSRAWMALLRLDVSAAFQYHPLFWLPVPAGIALLCRRRIPRRVGKVLLIALCVVLLLTAFKRTKKNADTLLLGLCGGGVVILAARVLSMLTIYGIGQSFKALLLSLLGAAVTIGGVYAIRRFLLGERPLEGKNAEDLKGEFAESFSDLKEDVGEASAQAHQAVQDAQTVPETGSVRMKTDRSLLAYILLSIITCGIYSYYFLYTMARDANVICSADGKKTGGLLAFILLSFITCGFYAVYWYYNLGNRLAENAPRYGMNFQENGTTILLWYLVGALLCGIGPFVAMHILIKNMNSLSVAYNQRYGF